MADLLSTRGLFRRRLGLENNQAVLGDEDGIIFEPGNPGYVRVRQKQPNGLGAYLTVKMRATVTMAAGMPVFLGYDEYSDLCVINTDFDGQIAVGYDPTFNNPAALEAYSTFTPSQFAPLSTYPASNSGTPSLDVIVREWLYVYNGTLTLSPATRVALSSYVPTAGNHRLATIFLKTDNTLEVFASTTKSTLDPLGLADAQETITARTAGSIPIASWKLSEGQTFIAADTIPFYTLTQLINLSDSVITSAAPVDATYITQTPNSTLTNEQALSLLASGIMKSTTATGVVSTVAAPTGAVVGDTDTQTLANKTFDAPTIADLTNAQHPHNNAAGGGQLNASNVFSAGLVSTARGGTGVDLSASGGARQVVKILSTGAITAAAILLDELPDAPMFANGRLTLQSGSAVPSGDVTGISAQTIYFTPFNGATISIYNGTRWLHYSYTERSLSLSGLTVTAPYDIFIYDNAGTLTLEHTVWTGSGLRATTLTLQNGVLVRSGGAGHNNRLYLGTIQMQATGQGEQSIKRMFVWNNYNRRLFPLKVVDTTDSWTTTSTTFQSLNGSTVNRAEMVIGQSTERVRLTHTMYATGNTGYPGICLNGTADTNADIKSAAIVNTIGTSIFNQFISVGNNFLQLTQRSFSSTTLTMYGDNAVTFFQMGGEGEVWA